YRYFESKDALVNTLYQKWKGALFSFLLKDFPYDAPPRQQFHELWQRLGRFALPHPRVFFFLELHHPGHPAEKGRKMEEDGLRLLQGFVKGAQALQVLKPVDSEILIAMVYGAFVGLLKGDALGYLPFTAEVLAAAEQVMWEAIRQ